MDKAASFPELLRLEVKVNRSGSLNLSARDLEGLGEHGYVAFLVTDRLCRGPRWVLIPERHLSAGTYAQSQLAELGEGVHPDLLAELNRLWSNWLLDEASWQRLLDQDNTGLKDALAWCLQEHTARESAISGTRREGKTANALQAFRDRIDEKVPGEKGPQQEGFMHQYLLADALEKLGYAVSVNPIGVPDIEAKRAAEPKVDFRKALEAWTPEHADLAEIVKDLRALDAGALDELRAFLRDAVD